jgi:hypothetical protein
MGNSLKPLKLHDAFVAVSLGGNECAMPSFTGCGRDFGDYGAGALTAGWIFVLLPDLKFSLRRTVLP